MASVQFGGGVASMRGQIGGTIFSKWRGIGTARQRSMPVTRMQTTQPKSRAWLGWFSRHWGTLSSAVRALWQVWADEHPGTDKFGQPFIMTGMNAYLQLNVRAAKVGGVAGTSDSPPLANLDQTVQDFVAAGAVAPGGIDLTWSLPNVGDALDFIEVRQAGPFASPALAKLPAEMDFKETVAGNLLVDAVVGLVEGGWYWFAVRYVGADGQASNWHIAQSQPTPTP